MPCCACSPNKKTYEKADSFFTYLEDPDLKSWPTWSLSSFFSAVPTTRYTSLGKEVNLALLHIPIHPGENTHTMDFVERLPVEIKIIWIVYLFVILIHLFGKGNVY